MEIFLIWVLCAVFSAVIASAKDRSGFGWFVLGFLFGPFALIAVGFMPSLKTMPGAPTPATHVKCPDCAELVLNEARVCKHCGCRLVPQGVVPEIGSKLKT